MKSNPSILLSPVGLYSVARDAYSVDVWWGDNHSFNTAQWSLKRKERLGRPLRFGSSSQFSEYEVYPQKAFF